MIIYRDIMKIYSSILIMEPNRIIGDRKRRW
jgi:hypothetical protein